MKYILFLLLSKFIDKYLKTEFNNPKFSKYISNYDGDTITIDLDGPNLSFYKNVKVRLKNKNHDYFDTAEMRGGTVESKALAKKAKEFTYKFFSENKKVYIEYKSLSDTDKYGRLLADFYIKNWRKKIYLTDLLHGNKLGFFEKYSS